ncbi:hypothetical protein HPB48_018064 [Haemaphysalis longicornis]|uniref:Reverse transcriptase domain-containing protein n=1 Tax=Haemaphysalis longicornis TaxID=44386 RepID=A0A9J6F9U7_HAELO|nr:hypothetical protein HPB48_018064 [Haemaphysalis longicornis]
MNSGSSTDLNQLDLSNAFDTLDHVRLATKAAQAGLRGALLFWLSRLLVGRSERVLYCGSCSRSYCFLSVVHECSVPRPTLFNLYPYDMPHSKDVLLVQYAEDTSILACVLPSVHSLALLHDHLTRVSRWATANHLSISTTKSVLLRLHNSKRAASPIYTLGDSVLPAVSSASILGVQFTPPLDFSLHISNIEAKARRTLGFGLRTSKPCGPETFCTLYTALELPRLEYCSSVWNIYQLYPPTG